MSSRSMSLMGVWEMESAEEREFESAGEVWKLGRVQKVGASEVPAPPRG